MGDIELVCRKVGLNIKMGKSLKGITISNHQEIEYGKTNKRRKSMD